MAEPVKKAKYPEAAEWIYENVLSSINKLAHCLEVILFIFKFIFLSFMSYI